MTRRLPCLVLSVLALLGLAVAAPLPAGASPPTIVIRNFGFTGDLTVAPGATVKVVNKDAFVHTLTYKPHGVFMPGTFNTGDIPANGGSRTFVAPATTGSYPFGCMHHPEMHGTLIVRRPPHPSALTSPSTRTVRSGSPVSITTRLTDTKVGGPIAGVKVYLYARAGRHGAFAQVEVRTTSATGHARATKHVSSLHQYRWTFKGNSRHKATTSGIGTISVQ